MLSPSAEFELDMGELRDRVWDLIYRKGRVEEAIINLNVILKENPNDDEALSLKALALNRLANSRNEWNYTVLARGYAEKALALNEQNDIALTNLAWALIDLGEPEKAVQYAARAVKINASNPFAWYNLAWAHYLLGDKNQALTCCEEALRISPREQTFRRGKDMLERDEVPEHLRPFLKTKKA